MVQHTFLPSGLMVVTDPLSHVDTVALNLTCFSGARHELGYPSGIAHFLEHMIFKGTARRDAYALSSAVESVGADMNAYTSREQTTVHARLLKKDMPLLLDIFADMLFHSLFDPLEGAKESKVITQEILQGYDTPDDYIFDIFQEAAFGKDSPLGTAIAGTPASVAATPMPLLKQFRDAHYTAHNMVLIASGAVDHDSFVSMASSYFADVPRGQRAPVLPSPYGGSGHVHYQRADTHQMLMVLGYGAPSLLEDSYIAACLLAGILGGGMSSRLFQEIREKHGLAYTISSYMQSYSDTGVFSIFMGCDPKDCMRALDLIYSILHDTCVQDTTEALLSSSKAQLRFALLTSMENPDSRSSRIASHCRLFGAVKPVDFFLQQIDSVRIADIRTIACRIFSTTPTLATLSDAKTFVVPPSFCAPIVW